LAKVLFWDHQKHSWNLKPGPHSNARKKKKTVSTKNTEAHPRRRRFLGKEIFHRKEDLAPKISVRCSEKKARPL